MVFVSRSQHNQPHLVSLVFVTYNFSKKFCSLCPGHWAGSITDQFAGLANPGDSEVEVSDVSVIVEGVAELK